MYVAIFSRAQYFADNGAAADSSLSNEKNPRPRKAWVIFDRATKTATDYRAPVDTGANHRCISEKVITADLRLRHD